MSTIPAPPPSSIRDYRGTAVKTLRERCAGLGMASWRCDNAGLILSDPSETGPVALFFGTPTILGLVSRTAAAWGKQDTPGVVEMFEGAWAVPVAESRRRDRTGCTIVLAMSERALKSETFEKACAEAAVEAAAVRRMLLPRARFEQGSGVALRDVLLWMGQDLLHVEESDTTVAGFTRQLSDCFETIDLLYNLGRSMNDLTRPGEFVSHMCERVRQTLSFGFVGVWFDQSDKLGLGLQGRMIVSGKPSMASDALSGEMRQLMLRSAGAQRAVVLTELLGQAIDGSGQVLTFPVLRGGTPVGAVLAGDKFGDDPQVSSYDIQLIEAAAGYVGAFLDNAGLYADQQSLFMGTLEALTAAIDAKDRYTRGHSQRVALLSWQLALATGMSPERAERVRIAGLVHDVGKIGVPEAVLTKAGKLTEEEFAAIKTHPEIGHRILRDLHLLEDVLPGVLHHHERYDGRGYPHGVKGENIPMIARIIALADTFDAMSSNRSYRAAMPRAAVLAEIQKCAGSQFDPALAKLFVTLDLGEFDRMVSMHASQQGGEARAA